MAFRKAVVSAVQEFQEEICDDVATLMVHNKVTVDRYLLQNKAKTAVKASRQLSKIMHSLQKDESSKVLQQSSRHQWSSEEEAILKNLFSEHIENCSISLDAVGKIANNDPLLSVLPRANCRITR